MMRITIVVGSLALAACGGARAEAPAQPAPTSHAEAAGGCPMTQPGVDVAVSDVDGGVALTFTADSDRVAELRAMARRMAAMHEQHMGAGAHHGGMHKGGNMHDHGGHGAGEPAMMMPPATVSVSDVDGGVRIALAAKSSADVDNLRAHARHHAERMRAGECPMMNDPAAPAPNPDNADHASHHPGDERPARSRRRRARPRGHSMP